MTTFVEFVEKSVSESPKDKLVANAAASLLASLRSHGHAGISKDALTMWIADMAIGGFRKTTRKRYFSRIHSLYREWKSSPEPDPFDALRETVGLDFESGMRDAAANLAKVGRLVRKKQDVPERQLINIFLYLLYAPSASLGDVINLRYDDETADCPQADDILESMRGLTRRSRYVFGLGQGKRRDTQIAAELTQSLHALLRTAGMQFGDSFSRESVTAMWMAAAVRAGVPYSEIRALVKVIPPGFEAFGLIPAAELSERARTAVIRRVAERINGNASCWFVMRLRRGVTPADIERRVGEEFPALAKKMTFYSPTHRVVRTTPGGRRRSETVPYLPGILFFRTRPDRVAPLFAGIGDEAWCYRTANTPDSPYCTISRAEMRAFQRHLGQFTPDIRMELALRRQPLAAGTPVRISGGGRMEGHNAVVESVRTSGGRRTYTLRLTDWLEAVWTVDNVEEVFIEPAGADENADEARTQQAN